MLVRRVAQGSTALQRCLVQQQRILTGQFRRAGIQVNIGL
jgi:hypothetical protein